MLTPKKDIAIIGGGPASLMLACSLDSTKYNISIYEKNGALGRKFLVAGKGGFNLTHSEAHTQFAKRYYPKQFIELFLNHFSNIEFREWLKSIGIETYVGTSKRVFPTKGIKPIEVLNAIDKRLKTNNVSVFYNHEWTGWENNQLVFSQKTTNININSDITVFALGGASWSVTGSDGSWTRFFKEKGIEINPFYPSNCAYHINWSKEMIKLVSGEALKNCEFTCDSVSKKGEAVLTDFGIEGSGIYGLSHTIRQQLLQKKTAELFIDFKPDLSFEEIRIRLDNRGSLSVKDVLEKKINLSKTQIDLIKNQTTKEEYNDVKILLQKIKSYPVTIVDFAPIDEAISTVGGISIDEVSQDLELKKMPNNYCIGEMLDWDAPTGGYLLQACFSMGSYLAGVLNKQ